MLMTPHQTFDELIIQELSRSPHLSLENLIRSINPKLKQEITLQAWYKALRRLQNQGVIIKQAKRYTLNVSWLVQVLKWTHTLRRTYIDQVKEKVIQLPTREKQKIRFRFPDLLALNSFWAHILVHIGSLSSGGKVVYAYNPHFWFYLAHGAVERQYNQSMKTHKVKTKIIIGAATFLDRWNAQFFAPKIIEHWLSPNPLYPEQHKYFNYLSGYFLEIQINKKMAQKIDHLFKRINSLAEISPLELIGLFQEKSPCQMIVSKNRQKGEAFTRKIKRYF